MISSALTAMEAGDTARTWAALQALADPVGMETAEAERAGVMLARLAGYDGSMRSRCSSGNGGDAIARTASDTNDRALSSPATSGLRGTIPRIGSLTSPCWHLRWAGYAIALRPIQAASRLITMRKACKFKASLSTILT
jgi:hypothetical protein